MLNEHYHSNHKMTSKTWTLAIIVFWIFQKLILSILVEVTSRNMVTKPRHNFLRLFPISTTLDGKNPPETEAAKNLKKSESLLTDKAGCGLFLSHRVHGQLPHVLLGLQIKTGNAILAFHILFLRAALIVIEGPAIYSVPLPP